MFSKPPTRTADDPTISFQLPDGQVAFTHPTATEPDITVTHLAPGSLASVPMHWHVTHGEHMRVRKGYLSLTIGRTTRVYGPGDGVADIAPYQLHSFVRADAPAAAAHWQERAPPSDEAWKAQEVIFEEWTTPRDGHKEIFFRNLVSFYKDFVERVVLGQWRWSDALEMPYRVVQLLHFQACTDNYPLLLPPSVGMAADGTPTTLARVLTAVVLGAASAVGWLCGWHFWKEEYTPLELQPVCKSMEAS